MEKLEAVFLTAPFREPSRCQESSPLKEDHRSDLHISEYADTGTPCIYGGLDGSFVCFIIMYFKEVFIVSTGFDQFCTIFK